MRKGVKKWRKTNETNKEPNVATHLAPPFPKVDYNFGNSNCIKKL
jgi:hypothetical protein